MEAPMRSITERKRLKACRRHNRVLKNPKWDVASQAYLVSDIAFLRDLFKPFPFDLSTREQIEQFLIEAERSC